VDWIGLGQQIDGLDWIGFQKMDPCTTLIHIVTVVDTGTLYGLSIPIASYYRTQLVFPLITADNMTTYFKIWHDLCNWLNRLRCHLGCGPKEACATWGHIATTWRTRLNCPCLGRLNEVVTMRPYVKLLWPLVIIIIIRPHRPYYIRRCGLLLPTE